MNDAATLLILIALVAGALLVQHLISGLIYGAPEEAAREALAISPNGEVTIRSRLGQSFAFHRNEMFSVRGRDRVDGLAEVVIDLFERRIVVDVSSKAVQQEMVVRLAR